MCLVLSSEAIVVLKGVMSDERNFPDLCPQPVVNKVGIKVLAIFGKDGEEVIVVTTDDRVFGFGSNCFGRLGLGVSDAIERPQLNATLTGKKIMKICYGLGHCLGLTSGGQCYGWGQNSCGQLGIGSVEDMSTPQPIKILSLKLRIKPIQDISCGDNHSLALTSDGIVYSFGANDRRQCGHESGDIVCTPTKLTIKAKFVTISCGRKHSAALSCLGTVYVWGNNERKQLGPLVIPLDGQQYCCPQPIKQYNWVRDCQTMICGPNHTILMTANGMVRVIGFAKWKPDVKNGYLFNAVRVSPKARFKRIDTTYSNRVVIATAMDGQHFIMGTDNKGYPSCVPIDIPMGCSLFDVYAKYCAFDVTFTSIVDSIPPIDPNTTGSVASDSYNDFESGFNNENFADEEIYVSEPEEYDGEEEIQLETGSQMALDLSQFDPLFNKVCHKSDSSIFDGQSLVSISDPIDPKTTDNTLQSTVGLSYKDSECGDNEGIADQKYRNTDRMDPMMACFQKHLLKAFNNRLDSDLRFIVENKSIYCHKTVLKIRNKEFWRICEQNMINENEININAYSYDTFHTFLMCLYGMRPEVNDQNCTELLVLAKEYGEQEIKDMRFGAKPPNAVWGEATKCVCICTHICILEIIWTPSGILALRGFDNGFVCMTKK
ncbi:unnamed protein product [Medioppia subpectinata]|uniref:BTB domain-containing protein n=1 Tax=Medioppia subpectinata TaxID=1979941 RepID=A0A7R9L1C3_9ACAR|nr:unnamed protein product [Medioppia subpectinata]CAG2113663.1 unnamed protein product [Medioppia subpectinata]